MPNEEHEKILTYLNAIEAGVSSLSLEESDEAKNVGLAQLVICMGRLKDYISGIVPHEVTNLITQLEEVLSGKIDNLDIIFNAVIELINITRDILSNDISYDPSYVAADISKVIERIYPLNSGMVENLLDDDKSEFLKRADVLGNDLACSISINFSGCEANKKADDNLTVDPLFDDILSALDKICSEIDQNLKDKKLVSDMMLNFESLDKLLVKESKSDELALLARALGQVYEESLMSGIDDPKSALGMTAEGILIIRQAVSDSLKDFKEEIVNLYEAVVKKFSLKNLPTLKASDESSFTAIDEEAGSKAEDQPKDNDLPIEKDGDKIKSSVADLEGKPDNKIQPNYLETKYISIETEDDLSLYIDFVVETADNLVAIENGLLSLESEPDNEGLINTIFRSFHSLKGAAGFLNLTAINLLCHESETLLDKIRKKTLRSTQSMIDSFLQSVDIIKILAEKLNESALSLKSNLANGKLRVDGYDIFPLISRIRSLGKEQPDDEETLSSADIAEKSQPSEPTTLFVSDGKKDDQSAKKKKELSWLKVETNRLDTLLELVGELVISQSILIQDSNLITDFSSQFYKNMSNLGKITKNIQDHVMNLRMIPLRQTFQKMTRLVRDLSKKMNKRIKFDFYGEDTELDKTLIDELNDPLVHIMRNSLDHGIEDKETRIERGKNPEGRITLRAYHKGSNVYIEIEDDGKGMDKDLIVAKAIEKNLISTADGMSESEILQMVFMPGFSTAKVVTDVSGRGVGMDVVRSNIEHLGGRTDISSKYGHGSKITIKLPLTMAIVDGMVIRIAKERFVIPTVAIRESFRPSDSEIKSLKEKGEMIVVRGKYLPLIWLGKVLNVSDYTVSSPSSALAMIVESDEKEYGFIIDELIGQQQVVIKNLGDRFRGIPGISGGTILGDGRVGLILDVSGVVSLS